MKIPFDVKYRHQIESGEYKVETRDGREVSIACWDAKRPNYPIIAEVFSITWKGDVITLPYKVDGTTNAHPDTYLFIITPEPELTEFEKKVYGMITNKFCVKEWSKTLLDLARKQIEAEKKQSKRLPTIEEWKWLVENCEWKWDKERKGQIVTAKNGNSIFLPAAGYRYDNCLYNVCSNGRYWSSSPYMDYPGFAYGVYFYQSNVTCGDDARYYGFSVRLVSDTPQEGFIDMGNNLFWAEKNEEGYFTYDEAMKLFKS